MSRVKEKMIEIATETAQKAGLRAITMRELGDAVGIKSSSVMYHFHSKDGLLQVIASSYTDLFFKRLDEIEVTYPHPKKRLKELVGLFEAALHEDKMCLCGILAAESAELDHATQNTTQEFFQRMESWITSQLKKADADPTLAPLIVSSLEGAMLLDRLDGKSKRLKAVQNWLVSLTTD